MPKIKVDRDVFLAADKETIVAADSPDAAFLWARAGAHMDEDEAKRVGYTDGAPVAEDADSGLTVTKEADEHEDKAVAAPEADKAPTKKAAPRKRAAKRG